MRARAAVVVALAACAAVPGRVAHLASLGWRTVAPGEVTVSLTISTPRTDVARVRWELAVDGRRVGAGVSGAPEVVDGGVVVVAPLRFPAGSWDESPRTFTVQAWGELQYRAGGSPTPFTARLAVSGPGAPAFEVGRD